MGIQIVRVPPDFEHPQDGNGNYCDGAHHEPLWHMTDEQKTCIQLYQNVSDGTPVSPIFQDASELTEWMISQGQTPEAAAALTKFGHAPSFAIADDGIVSGPEAMARAMRNATEDNK